MKFKTITTKKKVTKYVTETRPETYTEAFTRLKNIITTEFSIGGADCEAMMKKRRCSCDGCPLGISSAPEGSRCIETRLINSLDDTIRKLKEENL